MLDENIEANNRCQNLQDAKRQCPSNGNSDVEVKMPMVE